LHKFAGPDFDEVSVASDDHPFTRAETDPGILTISRMVVRSTPCLAKRGGRLRRWRREWR
jgi:hypothetical protein